ncbi:MAG: hypothetical protein OXB84_06130 [Halobacteriovoraceae bacterium]|nr:hypothetical protein [Halobacteriovoraceae bacterium]
MIKKIWNFLKNKKNTLPYITNKNAFKIKGKKWEALFSKIAEFSHNILQPAQRLIIHKTFIYTCIVLLFFGMGSILALLLQGPITQMAFSSKSKIVSPQSKKGLKKELALVKKVNLFNVGSNKDKIPSLVKRVKGKQCTESNSSSGLPLKLMHTTVLQDSVKSLASVQIRGKRKLVDIREGERVNGMGKIGRIARQKVFFKNIKTGQCEFIENIKQAKIKSLPSNLKVHSPEKGKKIMKKAKDKRITQKGNKFVIKKALKTEMMGNISEILTQARAIQIKNPDGTYSFKMTEIVPGSIYSQLNIENGDIIEEINGKKINDLNQVMSLFGRMDSLDKLKLTINKQGDSQEYDYQFE